MSTSLCDRCIAPGACCREFYLNGGPSTAPTVEEAVSRLSMIRERGAPAGAPPLPFVPSRLIDDGSGHPVWLWSCPKLGADGRCTTYDARPQLCRIYQPLDDGMCAHFAGGEAGDASAGVIDDMAGSLFRSREAARHAE